MKVLNDKILGKKCRNYIMKIYFTLIPASTIYGRRGITTCIHKHGTL
jgi:hypothetical protein